MDSLLIILGYGLVVTLVVMLLAVWRAVLKGGLKTSLVWRKPLLIPAIVFILASLIVVSVVPLPMAVYHGANQYQTYRSFSGQMTVYDSIAYENDIQLKYTWGSGNYPNEWVEVSANFSQDGVIIQTVFVNMTEDDLDEYYSITRSVNLDPGVYDIEINNTHYIDDVSQGPIYITILVHQSLDSSFFPEITSWSSYQFLLGIGFIFLFLAGACVGREEKTRRSEQEIDQEPPRDELYTRRY